jgi:choice-of-anchor A domain-containing protein
VLGNDGDIDGDPLTASLVSPPAHGVLALALDGAFAYQPEANFRGNDSFTYAAKDGTSNSNTVTVSLTITGVPLGLANDFNIFILGNMAQHDGRVGGRLAVGGDANLSDYRIGRGLPNSHGTRDDLIVDGRLIFTGGTVAKGNAVSGDKARLSHINIPNGRYRKGRPIDFGAQRSLLRHTSADWSSLPPNGTTSVRRRDHSAVQIILSGADPHLNIFRLAGRDLATARKLTINVPAGSTVLVNIDGKQDRMKNLRFLLSHTERQYVIYNFYQANSLTLAASQIEGTILAPFARINFVNGTINGIVIGAALRGAGVANHHPFKGDIPTPEP